MHSMMTNLHAVINLGFSLLSIDNCRSASITLKHFVLLHQNMLFLCRDHVGKRFGSVFQPVVE